MFGLGLGVLGLGLAAVAVSVAKASGDVKQAATTAADAKPQVQVYHSFGLSPEAKAAQKAERDARHKGKPTKLPKVNFSGVMQGVSTLADALSGPAPTDPATAPASTTTPAGATAPATPAPAPAAAPAVHGVEIGQSPTVPDERARIAASILYLRNHNIRPWSSLPGGGTVITWSEVNKYGLASRKEIRNQESFVDRYRTGADKGFDDFVEWLTIQDETVANMRDWLFWYVPDWKKVAKGDTRRSSGAKLIALGQSAEVRDVLINALHNIGQNDPWAHDRAQAWAMVVSIAGTIATVVLAVIPGTQAAAVGVGAGTAAAAAAIAKSGDGVSLDELNEAVASGTQAAAAAKASGASSAAPSVGAVPRRAHGARAMREFLRSGVVEPIGRPLHRHGFVGVLCDAATEPAIIRAAGDAARRENAEGHGVVATEDGLFVWFGPRAMNALEGYLFLANERSATVGAVPADHVDPHYLLGWLRSFARSQGVPASHVGLLPHGGGVVVYLSGAQDVTAAGDRLAQVVDQASRGMGLAAGVTSTARPGAFLVWVAEEELANGDLCALHDKLVA